MTHEMILTHTRGDTQSGSLPCPCPPLRPPQDQQRCKARLAGLLTEHERQKRDYERVAHKERLKQEVRLGEQRTCSIRAQQASCTTCHTSRV